MFTDTVDAALVRDGFAAFGKGDFETLGQLLAEDIEWQEGGNHPLAGTYRGRDAVFGFFGRAVELTEGSLRPEPIDIAGTDGRVLVRTRTTGRRPDGRTVDIEEFQIFELDSQVRRVRSLVPDPGDAAAWDAFWTD